MGSLWPSLPFILPQATTTAGGVDAVLTMIHVVAMFFIIGIFSTITFFAIRYRRGSKVNRVLPDHEGIALELTWTIIPLIILVGMFVWSTSVYFSLIRVPAGAMEVMVVDKQWMWKLQQPNGRWEMNELHVPVGRAVKLTMISEDVIHDFGVPAFRIKQDVIPGKYTQTWFQPTQTGRFRVFCSQYCGTKHSIMGGFITVMEPADYQRWLSTGNLNGSTTAKGEELFRQLGCTGCHGANANVRAPSLEGIWGKPVPVQIPEEGNQTRTVIADYRYIHDSIVLPEKEIAGGYKPIMPSYRGQISEEEMVQLIDYIRSLGTSNGTANGSAREYVPEASGGSATPLSGSTATANMGRYPDRDRIYGATGSRSLNAEATANLGRYPDRDRIYDENNRGGQYGSGSRSGLVGNRPDTVGSPQTGQRDMPVDAPEVYSGIRGATTNVKNPAPTRGSSSTPELDRSTNAR